MDKIVILSDTHGNRVGLNAMSQIFDECDKIIFAGDGLEDFNTLSVENRKKLIKVKGNCDQFTEERERIFEIGGKKFFLTHGDMYSVKYGMTKISLRAKEVGADVVIFGHTHVNTVIEDNGITYINPGTLSRYTTQKTFCYLVISDGKLTAKINADFFAGI